MQLPDAAKKVFDELQGGSYASYAIRFAASQEGVMMVLSGMGSMEMMEDNLSYMTDFVPLNEEENQAVAKVCKIIQDLGAIPCTACRYCTEVCPQEIDIPSLFSLLNAKKIFNNFNSTYYYNVRTKEGTKAKDCLQCGACEGVCPQHLEIRELLKDVSKAFDA